MKIIRSQRWFRMKLTDGEFEVLGQLVAHSLPNFTSASLSLAGRRALAKFKRTANPLSEVEDRRNG